MSIRELLEDAYSIITESDGADEHSEWIRKAKSALDKPSPGDQRPSTNDDPRWLAEFGAKYDVPLVVIRELEDTSWHNDASPSFSHPHGSDDRRLWIEHPDPECRECEGKRYTVSETGTILYAGDDLTAALSALKPNSVVRNEVAARLRQLGYNAEVYNTGGHVMCIAVSEVGKSITDYQLIIGNAEGEPWGADIYEGGEWTDNSVTIEEIKPHDSVEQIAYTLIQSIIASRFGDPGQTSARVLCAVFCDLLSQELTEEQIALVNTQNRAEVSDQVCHTHDVCDSNQIMLNAGERLGIDVLNNQGLVNQAWDMAKSLGFMQC